MANRKARRTAKTLINRDAILAMKGGRYEEIDAFGWTWRVAAVSAGARDAFELALQDMPEDERRKDFRARLLVMSCIGDDGKPAFAPSDIPSISSLEAAKLDPVVEVAMRLNGLTQTDRAELEGNS